MRQQTTVSVRPVALNRTRSPLRERKDKKKERKGVKRTVSAQSQQSRRFMLHRQQVHPPTAFSNIPLSTRVWLREGQPLSTPLG